MHTFNSGDHVAIINQTMSGRFILEGFAEIVKPVVDVDEQYVVRFGYDETCERFVDPSAQANPAEFVAKLNTSVAS